MSRPLLITGMHRAGTSMVARAAQALGLYLGHPDDLVPGAPDNPDGFFEHAGLVAASEALFHHLGAGWDCPPVLTASDLARPGLEAARDLARPALAELATHPAWAWKDPRAAPVLPFWLDLVPDAGVVLCLRNPLEVAASLRTRNGTSLPLGLRLWFTHLQAAADATPVRLVTHYDAWFHRPHEEIARLAAFAGLDPSPAAVAAAAAVPARHRRHARFDAPALRTARVHPELRQLYERLAAEAGWPDGSLADPATNGSAADTPPASDGRALGQVQPWVVDVGLARYETNKRNGRVAQLERELAQRAAVPPSSADLTDLQAGLYDVQLAVAELTAAVVHGHDADARVADIAYARMIRGVRSEVRRVVDPDGEVLVLSDGEPALVDLHGRRARHFPVAASPVAPGPRPADGEQARAHLVARRALGATHLVVPWTAGWWLHAYPAFATHLAVATTVVAQLGDGTTVHRLHGPGAPRPTASASAAIDAARTRFGDDPSILDATAAGLDLPDTFRPLDVDAQLPYLDASVDAVIVDATASDGRRADAARVAARGVLVGGGDGWAWTWTGSPSPIEADVVVAAAPLERPAPFLDAVLESLPPGWIGDLVVVAPNGAVEAWRRAAADRATVVAGRVGATLRELAAAEGPAHIVLVDGSAIPLPGWLPGLLSTFQRSQRVGLAGGRRRLTPGAPVVAAHAVVGGDLQPTLGATADRVARPVDIAVPGLTAWRRAVLAAHPLDDRFATLDFALADHCWALAAADLDCLVQPLAECVDLGLGAADDTVRGADRARLDESWVATR